MNKQPSYFCALLVVVLQVQETSDEHFSLTWTPTGMFVSVYHLDAQRMANKIPKQDYGTYCYRCVSITLFLFFTPLTVHTFVLRSQKFI